MKTDIGDIVMDELLKKVNAACFSFLIYIVITIKIMMPYQKLNVT